MLRPTLVDTRPDSTPEPTLRLAQETVLTGRFGERPFPVHRGTRQLRKQQTFLDAGIDLNEVRTPKQTVQPAATTGPDCVFVTVYPEFPSKIAPNANAAYPTPIDTQ